MRILPTHGHQWLTSCPGCFNPGKEPHYPYTEGCVGPRAGSDVLDKRKIFCPYQDLKPGSSSYTDHATLSPKQIKKILKSKKYISRHSRPAGGV